MNLELIRQLDSKIGGFACSYLYYYDRFRALFPPLRRSVGIKNILVIKFWGIGNLVHVSPTLRAIRGLHPDAKIVFLTLEQNKGVYEGAGLYDEVWYLRLTTLWDFTRAFFRLFFQLRAYQFDLIIDLEPLVHFAEIISFYVGVGTTVGFSLPGRKSLFTKPVEFREDEHIARTFYRILEPFGVRDEPTEKQLLAEPIPANREALAAVDELLRCEAIGDHDFLVGVNVNASEVAEERRWPLENFAALMDLLIQRLKAKVVLLGAPDEVPYVDRVIAMMREDPVSLAGRTTLPEAIAAISRLDLFITNDSGPLHLAYAVGVPTISFYGPESPSRYGPLGPRHQTLYKGLNCSPCIFFKNLKKINCRQDALCLREISLEEAYRLVEQSHGDWLAARQPAMQ